MMLGALDGPALFQIQGQCRGCQLSDIGSFQLFDFSLDDYPNKPPEAEFLTTGGGTAVFNPNLYSCGKVCLSLLGTWEGQL